MPSNGSFLGKEDWRLQGLDIFFFIKLIGLRGIQPYAPLRVMRRFGVIQDILLWSIMGLHEETFTLASLERIKNMQAGWEYMIDLDIGKESWCMSKYYTWRNVVSHMAHPSVRGLRRFVDNQRIDWVTKSVLPHMGFTTPMYNQIVHGSLDYLIQVVDEEEEEDPEEDPE
ncbi:hypothetical protein KY290_027641 [Solanum tuberosum]|uniref:Uncharacterized protein n=1 Tax=Solanum tuberosum TaxID=4113 RepID=A0ABQ7UFQ0_SOLTU|nr:hypothetical protein KY285_026599 [Solanum tuberosum]KAH0748409.1 hypothetical protein KY290_027641 [Solanum tuberosum]